MCGLPPPQLKASLDDLIMLLWQKSSTLRVRLSFGEQPRLSRQTNAAPSKKERLVNYR